VGRPKRAVQSTRTTEVKAQGGVVRIREKEKITSLMLIFSKRGTIAISTPRSKTEQDSSSETANLKKKRKRELKGGGG